MRIEEFVRKVKKQDSKNEFEKFEGKLMNVPEELQNLYRIYNPNRVEIGYNGTSIYLISAENLERENNNYKSFGLGFVFATCDGDPIFYNEGKVYTCPHGVEKPEWECLSETIEEYFDSIVVD